MKRFFTMGHFTQAYAKGIVAAPEDRTPALRKLVEAAGARFISFYFTTGSFDFVLVTEAEDVRTVTAIVLASTAAGTVTGLSTIEAFTPEQFLGIAQASGAAAAAYKLPG